MGTKSYVEHRKTQRISLLMPPQLSADVVDLASALDTSVNALIGGAVQALVDANRTSIDSFRKVREDAKQQFKPR